MYLRIYFKLSITKYLFYQRWKKMQKNIEWTIKNDLKTVYSAKKRKLDFEKQVVDIDNNFDQNYLNIKRKNELHKIMF